MILYFVIGFASLDTTKNLHTLYFKKNGCCKAAQVGQCVPALLVYKQIDIRLVKYCCWQAESREIILDIFIKNIELSVCLEKIPAGILSNKMYDHQTLVIHFSPENTMFDPLAKSALTQKRHLFVIEFFMIITLFGKGIVLRVFRETINNVNFIAMLRLHLPE